MPWFARPAWAQNPYAEHISNQPCTLSDPALPLKKCGPGHLRFFTRWSHHDFRSTPPLFQLRISYSDALTRRKIDLSRAGQGRIERSRAWLLVTANAGAIFFGYKQAIASWGKSKGAFHFKDDWDGDNLAQTDELSHFMWGYKMTQFLLWAYRWAGFSPKTSRAIAISQTALVLTTVEYPIDAYNPKQGVGISDLIFDYAGIGLACMRQSWAWLEDFDVKISSKGNLFAGNQPVFAQTYDEFDNFVYWLTYRARLFLPEKVFCFGLGYGVTHKQDRPQRQFFGGIGLSLPDFVSLFGDRVGRRVKFLEMFYPNLNVQF